MSTLQRVGWAETERNCASPPGRSTTPDQPQPLQDEDRWFVRGTIAVGVMVWVAFGVPLVLWIA